MLRPHRHSAVCGLGDERIEPSATMLRSDCSFQGIVCVLPSEETLFQALTPVLPIVGSTVFENCRHGMRDNAEKKDPTCVQSLLCPRHPGGDAPGL